MKNLIICFCFICMLLFLSCNPIVEVPMPGEKSKIVNNELPYDTPVPTERVVDYHLYSNWNKEHTFLGVRVSGESYMLLEPVLIGLGFHLVREFTNSYIDDPSRYYERPINSDKETVFSAWTEVQFECLNYALRSRRNYAIK